MLVEETLGELGLRPRQPHARHLQYLRVGRERLRAQQRAKLPARFARELDAPTAYVVLALERDRVWHREIRRRVAGSLALRA